MAVSCWPAGVTADPMRRADRDRGTSFLLFPQAPVLPAWRRPERVVLSPPPGSLGPGPCDERIYVADAIGKPVPYGFPYLPPWTGPVHRPPRPGPDGHYDHLPPGSRDFLSAHLFGAVRHTLDVWEGYLGRPVDWHFRRDFHRLELVPLLDWDNAHSGYGFVETGWNHHRQGDRLAGAASVPGTDLEWLVLGAEDDWFVASAADLTLESGEGLDLGRGATRVVVDVPTSSLHPLPGLTASTVRRTAVALAAAEASGVTQWCLDTAVSYAKVREQFGLDQLVSLAVTHGMSGLR